MRLPRGIKLTNQRIHDGSVTFDVEIAWWRGTDAL